MNQNDTASKNTKTRGHRHRRSTKSDSRGSFSLVERSKSLDVFSDLNSYDKNKENCPLIINSTSTSSIITNQSNIDSNINPQNESPRSPTLNKSNSLDIINLDISPRTKTINKKDPPLRPVDSAIVGADELQKEEPVKNPKNSNIDIDNSKENPAIAEAPGLLLAIDNGDNVPEQQKPKKTKRSRRSKKSKKSSSSNNGEDKSKSHKRRRKLTRSKSNSISSPTADKQTDKENDLNTPKSPNSRSRSSRIRRNSTNSRNSLPISSKIQDSQLISILKPHLQESKTPENTQDEPNKENLNQPPKKESKIKEVDHKQEDNQYINDNAMRFLFKPPVGINDDLDQPVDTYIPTSDKTMAVAFPTDIEKFRFELRSLVIPIQGWRPFQISIIPDPDDKPIEEEAHHTYDFLHMINEMKRS